MNENRTAESYADDISLGYAVDKACDAAFEVMHEEIRQAGVPGHLAEDVFNLLNDRLEIRG